MMKKIKIIGLVSVIMLSMIGIPSIKHFCNLMEISMVGDCESVCNTCSHSQNEIESCCSLETETAGTYPIISHTNDCCSDEFILNKIDDEFVINTIELNQKVSQTEYAFTNNLIFDSEYFLSSKTISKDISPPLKTDTEVYILFHSLLI